jgi:hypothetical protein
MGTWTLEGHQIALHVAERNPRHLLMPGPVEQARPGGRVKARQFVGQKERVLVFVEVGANVHRLAQQAGQVLHLSLQARAQ